MRADPQIFEGIERALSQLEFSPLASHESCRAQQARVVLQLAGGEERSSLELLFGDRLEDTSRRCVRVVQRDGCFAVSNEFFIQLTRPFAVYRTKRLTEADVHQVSSFSLYEGSSLAIAAQVGVSGAFEITAPRRAAANQRLVRSLLGSAVSASIIRVHRQPPSALVGARQLTLQLTDGQSLALQFGQTEQRCWGLSATERLVAEVPQAVCRKLQRTPFEWYERRVAPFRRQLAACVSISAGSRLLAQYRRAQTLRGALHNVRLWRQVSPAAADAAEVAGLVYGLATLQVDHDDATPCTATPLVVQVRDAKEQLLAEVQFCERSRSGPVLVTGGDGVAGVISRRHFEQLFHWSALRRRTR